MDELFRFVTVRGAQSADASATIPLVGPTGTTAFQDSLKALRGPGGFAPMAVLARRYELAPVIVAGVAVGFADPISTLVYGTKMLLLASGLSTLSATTGLALITALDSLVNTIFGKHATDLVATTDWKPDLTRVHDSIVALFLAPSSARIATGAGDVPGPALPLGRKVSLDPLATVARMMNLTARVASNDATLALPNALSAAQQRTLILPPAIFPIDQTRTIRPVGIADLLVVRQHLRRYEPGEVTHIENLIAGESRSHTDTHTRTTESVVTTETDKTTETTTELQTNERFDLKQEVENTLKQDTSVKAGVDTSAKFGTTLDVNAFVHVAYNTAQESAVKSASDFAREVTKRAAIKVTDTVKITETTRRTETFVDAEEHGFDNSTGLKPIRGVYQWLNKVYLAQVFNYGKRLLFDITVPEPAAFLLSGGAVQQGKPKAPDPFTVNNKLVMPADLSSDGSNPYYYGQWLAKYNVTDVTPPPAERVVVAKAFHLTEAEDDILSNIIIDGENSIKIPDGYYLAAVRLKGFVQSKGDGTKECGIGFFVGTHSFSTRSAAGLPGDFDAVYPAAPAPPPGAPPGDSMLELAEADGEYQEVGVAIQTTNVANCTVNLELICKRTSAAYAQWQFSTWSSIVSGYQRVYAQWKDQLAAYNSANPQSASLPNGSTEENQSVMQAELKKSAVQLLAGRDLVTDPMGAVIPSPASPRSFPRPNLQLSQSQGSYIRFFEQAFEWEQMTYFFYPYFWGRPSTWYDKAVMDHSDPLFLEFLKAGEARVVVPVRPGFEADIYYFLLTGQIWSGGDLPEIGDQNYLPIVEELKAITGAPGSEVPQGDSWEIVVPSELVLLRSDGKVPAWKRSGDWTWVDDTDPTHTL